jgi:hypothetical protein
MAAQRERYLRSMLGAAKFGRRGSLNEGGLKPASVVQQPCSRSAKLTSSAVKRSRAAMLTSQT